MFVALFCINTNDNYFHNNWPTMVVNFLILVVPLSTLFFLCISNIKQRKMFCLLIFLFFGTYKLVTNLITLFQIFFIYKRIVIGNYYIFVADFIIDLIVIALTIFYLIMRLRELRHHDEDE